MKRLGLILLVFTLVGASPAYADWRWAEPKFKQPKVRLYNCRTSACKAKAKQVVKLQLKLKIAQYHAQKEREWTRWIKQYIPTCTWYGESGPGPQFAPFRYTVLNNQGSGARGKYQMMPGTYFSFAVYKDWSPLDQEIAGHRLYGSQGTSPWSAC